MNKAGSLIKYLKDKWFPVLLLAIGLHISAFQLFGYDLKNVIGDLGDSRFILSIHEYNYQWLIGNYNNYWDGFFMFPDKEVISYSDNLLGALPIYFLFRTAGADYLTAFQLLLLTCHVLNFIFCYYCFYKISGNKYAAASGAFIFAFSIVLNGVHNHPQYTLRFCIPLFFFFLYTYFGTLNIKYLLYATIALIYQFYLGIYLGYFMLILAVLFVLCYCIFNPGILRNYKKLITHQLIVFITLLLGLIPLFYFYYKRSQVSGFYNDYDFYMQTIPRLSSYLKSFPGSVTWGFLNNTFVDSKIDWMHVLFPGMIVFVSLAASIFLAIKNKKMYAVLLCTITIFVSFTLYYHGHTLYGYLMKIPGIKAVRFVNRASVVLIFFAGWLVCMNVTGIFNCWPLSGKYLMIVLPLLLLADNFCRPSGFKTFSKEECRHRVNAIEEKIRDAGGLNKYKTFAFVPGIKKDSQVYHIDAMLCALKLKCKTVNGYSSSCHKEFGSFWRNIDSVSLAGWCNAINFPIDSVLVVR